MGKHYDKKVSPTQCLAVSCLHKWLKEFGNVISSSEALAIVLCKTPGNSEKGKCQLSNEFQFFPVVNWLLEEITILF